MRDILDTLVQLTESTGLAGRKPGDKFTYTDEDGTANTLTFEGLKFFPEDGGSFGSQEQMNQALDSVIPGQNNIVYQNNPTGQMKAFGVATLTAESGETLYAVRFFKDIKSNFLDNYFPNTIVVDGRPYKLVTKAATKTQAGLTPQDLLKDKIDLTISDIMNQLASSLGTDHPLYEVAHNIAMGEPLPFSFKAPSDVSFSAFRDYFCEILQPIALQLGQFTGNAGEAAKRFLDGTFQNTLISFDDSKTAGLSDSVLTTEDGKSVLISTKGGKGATASVKNLMDKIEQMRGTKEGNAFIKKHNDVLEMIEAIKSEGQAGSPLYLGEKFGILKKDDAEYIRNLKGQKPMNLDDIDDQVGVSLTKNLAKLAKERSTDNPASVNMYYHLIAAVAHKAADAVNKKTDFPKVAADILNNGALVQVYTKAKEGKTEWTLQEFETVYPGESIDGVYLSAGKTYYSTGIKGNFTFKIDKGAGPPKDDEEKPSGRGAAAQDLSRSAELITGVRAKRSPLSKSTSGEVGNVGRAKRR